MNNSNEQDLIQAFNEEEWQEPEILEQGKIEARLFSDEPDPWGP